MVFILQLLIHMVKLFLWKTNVWMGISSFETTVLQKLYKKVWELKVRFETGCLCKALAVIIANVKSAKNVTLYFLKLWQWLCDVVHKLLVKK